MEEHTSPRSSTPRRKLMSAVGRSKADEGVAPYDSLSLIMTERWPKIPYFWHRMSNDVLCALICYLTGGVIGIGTLVTAFGLGPVIHFFNRHFTGKLLAWVDGE